MYDVVMAIIKLVIGIAVLPAVVAVSKSFYQELSAFKLLDYMFLSGAVAYVFFQLFIYSPAKLFAYIQKIFCDVLRFAPAAVTVVLPRLVPILPTFLLVLLYICHSLGAVSAKGELYFLFLIGFTLAMHIILTASELQGEDNSIIKAHYVFCITLSYVVNLIVIAFLLSLDFSQFSFTSFWSGFIGLSRELYLGIEHWMI